MHRQTNRAVHRLSAVSLLAMLLLSACAMTKSEVIPSWPSMTPLQAKLKVESDRRTLHTVAGQLESTRSELIALHQRGGWSKRGYFDSQENNQIERFYFRFVVGHTALWDTINRYGGPQAHFTDVETGTKAHALVLYAEFLLAFHTSFLVAEFMDTHINRLLVLRPILNDAERIEFLAVVVQSTLVIANAGSAADFHPLIGRWQRTDGGYVIDIRQVAPDGKMQARYYNPRAINVSRANASILKGYMKIEVELQDIGYPGSTYTLLYDPKNDALVGLYYQATQKQTFDVMFTRMTKQQ